MPRSVIVNIVVKWCPLVEERRTNPQATKVSSSSQSVVRGISFRRKFAEFVYLAKQLFSSGRAQALKLTQD